MMVLINNTKQQSVIGRQSKNWQNIDGIIGLDACMLMPDSGRNGLMQHNAYSGQDTSFNSSNMGQSSDGAYSGAAYGLDADIDVINQIEATRANPVDNTDASSLAGSEDAQNFDKESDALVKKTRQRVSGMLLRAVVLQGVIVIIWLLV